MEKNNQKMISFMKKESILKGIIGNLRKCENIKVLETLKSETIKKKILLNKISEGWYFKPLNAKFLVF